MADKSYKRAINISIPADVIEELDKCLPEDASRSMVIHALIMQFVCHAYAGGESRKESMNEFFYDDFYRLKDLFDYHVYGIKG